MADASKEELREMEFMLVEGRFRALESVPKRLATLGDYHTPLPEGWSLKESSSHPGMFYYIQPSGQAQWVPPLVRTGNLYAWKLLVYIEFGIGKLGMNLRSVVQGPDVPWQQFQVEIHELKRLPSGLPSPAEIYNWSVKPERRIYPGFRMVEIQGESIAGFSYSEVIEKINQTPRPVKIGFCDINRGLKGDPATDEEEEGEPEEEQNVYLRAVESEYMQTLVLTQLHKEAWTMDANHLLFEQATAIAKGRVLEKEMKILQMVSKNYTKEIDRMVPEKDHLQQILDQLELERRNTITPVELTRCQSLSSRQQELIKTIEQLGKDNERLQLQHAERTKQLDKLYKELDEEPTERLSSTQLFEEYNIAGPSIQKIDYCHMLYFQLQETLQMEQEKTKQAQEEATQLREHLNAMNSSDTDIVVAAANQIGILGSEGECSIRDLEMKLEWLRNQLHKTVTSIAKAEKRGNAKAVQSGLRRRTLLKSEVQSVHDELAQKRQRLGPQPSCSNEIQILERKLDYLHNALENTTEAMAIVHNSAEKAIYIERRTFLQRELQSCRERLEILNPQAMGRRSSNILGSPIRIAQESPFEDTNDRYDENDFRTSAFVDSPEVPGTPVKFNETLSPMSESPQFEAQEAPLAPPPIELSPTPPAPPLVAVKPPAPKALPAPEEPPSPKFLPLASYHLSARRLPETPPIVKPVEQPNSPDHGFAAQLTQALTSVQESQQVSKDYDEQKKKEDDRITESIRSLHDEEDDDFEDEVVIEEPNKIEILKKRLRAVNSELIILMKDKSQPQAVSKLLHERNKLKTSISLAHDQKHIDDLKQELRSVVAKANQATKQQDRTSETHWNRRRAELKFEISMATDKLAEATAEAEKEVKTLDELKNDLRAVVMSIASTTPNTAEMDSLLAQKHELKKLIISKQQEILKERAKRDESLSLEELKAQLKHVVVAMTKDPDNIMLQQRRKHIKQRIAKVQDIQNNSFAGSNNSFAGSTSTSISGPRSESSSGDSRGSSGPNNQRSRMNATELLVDRSQFNATELLVGRSQFNATELLVGSGLPPAQINNTPSRSNFADFRRGHNLAGTELQPGRGPPVSNYKRRSNSISSGGAVSHSSSESSESIPMHDSSEYATMSLDQLEQELINVKEAMRQHNDGLALDQLRRQKSELEARIARAELNAKNGTVDLRREIEDLKLVLKTIGTQLESTSNGKKFRALLQQRADVKAKLSTLKEQLVPEMPPSPAPLHPNASSSEIIIYISERKAELREVVQKMMVSTQEKDKASTSRYMTRRKELKEAIVIAQETLARRTRTDSSVGSTSRNPSEDNFSDIPSLTSDMTPDAVQKHIDNLKQELRQVVTAVAQSNGEKPKLMNRRSIIKEKLAQAQDHLARMTYVDPEVDKLDKEIVVVEQYIASLKEDLGKAMGKIHGKDSKSALYMMRRNDLKNNLSFAQDQLVEFNQKRKAAIAKSRPPQRSSMASSSSSSSGPKRDSQKFLAAFGIGGNSLNEPPPTSEQSIEEELVLTNENLVRMTQTYVNIPMQTGYLEIEPKSLKMFRKGKVMWCSIESSGCLCWYKSHRDLKHVRGMVDLAKTSSRTVSVEYSTNSSTFAIKTVSPGMISHTEEVCVFVAATSQEAQKWVYAIRNTIELLETAHPVDGFGRNSVVF
ncbi:hypothetical protein THRCLA_03960 [Thraustotheca clavata]|uniref:WW domain-containing protein n=1 Tax=Thraustotheca clavata TaxID=74557 RepID=A0A1W0A0M9_9STRA|nr:hypothetical protein THRCLA_03960 [Thraustotheca clavata]